MFVYADKINATIITLLEQVDNVLIEAGSHAQAGSLV